MNHCFNFVEVAVKNIDFDFVRVTTGVNTNLNFIWICYVKVHQRVNDCLIRHHIRIHQLIFL